MTDPANDTNTSNGAVPDRPLPGYYRRIKGCGATAMLSAAMIAVGEIFEPEKAQVEIARPDDRGDDPDGVDLRFGSLPSLD